MQVYRVLIIITSPFCVGLHGGGGGGRGGRSRLVVRTDIVTLCIRYCVVLSIVFANDTSQGVENGHG